MAVKLIEEKLYDIILKDYDFIHDLELGCHMDIRDLDSYKNKIEARMIYEMHKQIKQTNSVFGYDSQILNTPVLMDYLKNNLYSKIMDHVAMTCVRHLKKRDIDEWMKQRQKAYEASPLRLLVKQQNFVFANFCEKPENLWKNFPYKYYFENSFLAKLIHDNGLKNIPACEFLENPEKYLIFYGPKSGFFNIQRRTIDKNTPINGATIDKNTPINGTTIKHHQLKFPNDKDE
jgi:hypothetical protein